MSVLFEKDYGISAGAYANGNYYVCKKNDSDEPTTFSTIDLQTGNEHDIADISSLPVYKSMTYDYTTETMYLLSWKQLSKISLTDGKVTGNIPLATDLLALACSYDGRLYGINAETTELIRIDPQNGKLKVIGKTGEYVENMFQSLAFDHQTHMLYWSGYGDGGFLATIDTETGQASNLGVLGNYSEVTGLHIPFSLCPPEAPAQVSGLKAEPGLNGALSVSLSWKNPGQTYGGAALNDISGVKIYRDGILVHTLTPVTAGMPSAYTDPIPASGMRQYKIVPYNTVGEGAPRYANLYAGEDYPEEVTQVKLTKNGQAALLTWTPPAQGANKGWFNAASVRYKITRYPDRKVLETAYNGNGSYTDSSIQGLDVYSYEIEAFNASGNSDPVYSPQLAVGSQIIPPYYCDFSTQDHFDLWKVIDRNNDQCSWSYDNWEGCARFNPNYEKDADDWLITSPVHLEAGNYYKLILELDKVTWMETHENLRVAMGTAPEADLLTTLLADYPDFQPGTKSINLQPTQTGTYYIGLQSYSQKENIGFQIKSVKIIPSGVTDLSALSVSSEDSVAPVNSPRTYTVEVENKGIALVPEYTVELTDAEGNSLSSRKIEEPLTSNSKARIRLDYASDKEGIMEIYARVTAADDTNPSNDTTPKAWTVAFRKVYNVKGKVTDETGNALSGVFVKLTGYRPYQCKTAADGTFDIPEVYPADGYTLTLIKHGFTTEKRTVGVTDGSVTMTPVEMKCALNRPFEITVATSENGNTISWKDGTEFQQFRYDNGILGGAYGPTFVGPNALAGTVYEQPTLLTGMSWAMDENSGIHETVDVYVLALDKNGKPTSNVLFTQRNVPNKDTTWGEEETYWNHFTFPYPVETPNGFFVAVGSDKAFTLLVDDMGKREEYPFNPSTQYTSDDYTTGMFSTLEELFYPVNLFIRASGSPLGDNQAARLVKGYKVWRLTSGQEKNPSTWQELTQDIQINTTLNDESWKNATQGVYRYAVRTEFHNGQWSEYSFSEEVQKAMNSAVTIKIKTNTPDNETEGARVVLRNRDLVKEHQYEAIFDHSGQISFAEVWKGTYDLTVRKNGFDFLEVNALEIGNASNEFTFGPFELKESVLTPYNLTMTGDATDKSRTLYWNLCRPVVDDFESYPDFEINPEGKTGWQYHDGDNSFTYGIGDGTITFPNQNKRMAGIIFNPSATTPPMTGPGYEGIQAYSGEKFLAFIAASSQTKDNDDYLISPELNFEDNFKFRFYGRTCEVGLGAAEQMRVGYSLNGTLPGDFIWLTEETSISVPTRWTRYSYDIPAKARYVAINYVSYDLFMLMIDDVFIGYEGKTVRSNEPYQPGGSKRNRKCEIYLDGNKISETENCNYTFTNLSAANKTAGVRTVYASGSSELVTYKLDASSVEEAATDLLQVYYNAGDKTIYIQGAYSQAELFDAQGKLLSVAPDTGQMDAGSLCRGIYILRVVTEEGNYTQKINIVR